MMTATSLPAAALAADPPRPLPGYVPSFVTERQAGAWEDCIWAAAEMLLDKWTSGVTRVDRRQLRKLSGDTEGGSSLADVTKAFSRLGFPLTWSPIGGDNVTWPELLARLESGGGAILLGTTASCRAVWVAGIEPSGHAMAQRMTTRCTSIATTARRAGSS